MCIGSGQPLCPVHRVRRVHSTRVLGKRHSVANLWLYIYICIHTHDMCTHVHRRTHVFHWNRKGIRRARNSWASLSGSSSICRWTHEVRPCRAGTLYLPASTPPKTQMCTNLSNNPSIFFCPLMTGPSSCSSNLRTSYYARLLCEVRERGERLRIGERLGAWKFEENELGK